MSSVSSLNSLLSSAPGSTSSSSIDLGSLLAAATGATSPGIDVTSAVDAAIYAAQAPERVWQSEQSTLQSQMSALSSIQSALTKVSTDLNSLNDPAGPLGSTTVTSSNSSAVTGTSSSGAVVGTHTIVVNRLAGTASWYSSSLASSRSSLGSSTLTITSGTGTPTSFSLGTGDITSLSSLAGAINSASIGVRASVVTDTTGARLALVAQTSGSASNFTVTDGPASSAAWTSSDVSGPSTPLSASSFQISDGTSTSATVSVIAGNTLSDVANKINSQGLDLSASVVTDSTGAHLSIVSASGGNVTVSSDPTLVLTQPSVGSDASLSVDGVPVSSSSNTVTGAISGVTLNLQSVTNGNPVTLGVAADQSQIGAALSQFVSDYNSAASLLSTQFTFSTTSGSEGVLGGDATVRSLQSALLGVTGLTGSSCSSSGSSIKTLADLGITMNNDGTLSLDTAALDQAVTANASGIASFFQGTSFNGFASQAESQLQTFTNPTANGALTSDMNSMTQQYSNLQRDVNNYESGYIASQRTVLTTMYSNAEIALQQLPAKMKELQSQLSNGNSSGN